VDSPIAREVKGNVDMLDKIKNEYIIERGSVRRLNQMDNSPI